MADNDIEVRIGADTSGGESKLADFVEGVSEKFAELTDHLSGTSVASTALGVALGEGLHEAIEKLKEVVLESIEAFAKFGHEIEHMQMLMGGTSEHLSELAVQLGAVGVSTSTYEGVVTRLARRLESSSEAFDRNKVAYKDANGELLSSEQILNNVIAKLQTLEAGSNRNRVATELMGRGFQSLAGIMTLTYSDIADANTIAQELGTTMSEHDLKAAHDFEVQTHLLSTALHGMYI